MISLILAIILCYLIGSIPTAYIFGRLIKRIDIRNYGSGNIGATNILRTTGKLSALIVLLFDIIKGAIAVTLIANLFLHISNFVFKDYFLRLVLGLSVIIGHNWMIFLKFRGGKGVATSVGVIIGLSSQIEGLILVLISCFVVWLLVVSFTRYVSLGSILASISFPFFSIIFGQRTEMVFFSLLICLLIIYKHRKNIKRLIKGEEGEIFQ